MVKLFDMRMMGVAAAALFAFLSTGEVRAHAPSDPKAVGDIRILVGQSNLIARGKIANVSYVNAFQKGGNPIPFVFVTYDISDLIFATEGKPTQVTLRFIGGPDGQGRFLSVEGVPMFQPGDEDVLFVRSNGEDGCAVVMCEFGRYRIFKEAVYEAHGSPVTRVGKGRITTEGNGPDELNDFTFPAPTFDELIKNPAVQKRMEQLGLTIEEARKRFEAEAPTELTISNFEKPRILTPKFGMSVGLFMDTLKKEIAAIGPKGSKPVLDADPKKEIIIPEIRELLPADDQ